MLKIQSKNLIIFIGLFLTFFWYSNAFALDTYELGYGNPSNSTGLKLIDTGFDENGLFFDFTYSNLYSSDLSLVYESVNDFSKTFFPAFYAEWQWYKGVTLKDLNTNESLIVNSFDCFTGYKETHNDPWGERDWCKVSSSGTTRLYATGLRFPNNEWGNQLQASNWALTESEISNNIGSFFGSDNLVIVSSNAFFLEQNPEQVWDIDTWYFNYPNGDSVSSFFGGGVSVNGSCGISDGGFYYYDNPPANLCSTGTSDDFIFTGIAHQSGSNWAWDCLGENGGTTESCTAYLDPNSAIDGVCGDYANQTFDTVEDFNPFSPFYKYHKCSEGFYSDYSFGAIGNTIAWYCSGINNGISAFCTAKLTTSVSDPFEYDDFEVPDFYEDLTNKGWLVDALTWLFLPTSETLNDSYKIGQEFRHRAPLGYLAKFHDFFMSIVDKSPDPAPFPELTITPYANAEPIIVFNYVSFVESVGLDNFSRFYHLLELLIGASVIVYLGRRGISFIKELK